MTSVKIKDINNHENDLINSFYKILKQDNFFANCNLQIIYDFIKEVLKLETSNLEFFAEYENLEINRDNLDISPIFCDYSNSLGVEIKFTIDVRLCFEKYINKKNIEDRLDGMIYLLLLIYEKAYIGKEMLSFIRGELSLEVLEISREIVLKNIQSNLYKDNYNNLYFIRYAKDFSQKRLLEIIQVNKLKERALELINKLNENGSSGAIIKLGKIKYMDKYYSKEEILPNVVDYSIAKSPQILYDVPVLQKQYNIDGTKKTLTKLFGKLIEDSYKILSKNTFLDELKEEIQEKYLNCQFFYYELIIPMLHLATEKEYIELVEKYGVMTVQNILSNMEKYFNHRAQEKLGYIESNNKFYELEDEVKKWLKHIINSIVRFRNGGSFNDISEKLLREGGFIRGTREFFSKEMLKRKKLFANSLIGVYDAIETESEYKQRAENEKLDIDEVINAMYYNRFDNFERNITINSQDEFDFGNMEVVRIVQLLKIAKIIEVETNKNYFEEFLRIPDINRWMYIFERDKNGYLKECIKKSQIRIKKVVYPLTEAEEHKYKNYILGKEIADENLDINEKIGLLNKEMDENKLKS